MTVRRDENQQVGYLELVSGNPNFRRLWFGDIVSLLGDWFNTIAIYSIVERLSGSPFAMGLVFVVKLLPFALASPLAGLIADRFNRRRLMLAADLVRAILVLGFLFVRSQDDLWLLYVLSALQVAVGAVFLPARSASVPNIVTERELMTANALMSATWSVLLAVGAALGGFATQWFGEQAVFAIDSATYVVSAAFIYRTVIPQERAPASSGPLLGAAIRQIAVGWREMRRLPQVGRIALAKMTWALGGSACVFMLTLLGNELVPGKTAVGIGLLFSMRGLGTGIGPILARSWFRDESLWATVMGVAVISSGVFYLLVGSVPWTPAIVVVVLVLFAHIPSGANWVLSSVLLQKRTPDVIRGRVFATEWLALTLVDATMILVAGALLEGMAGFSFSLRQGFLIFAALEVLAGVAWLILVVPKERAWFSGQAQPEPPNVWVEQTSGRGNDT